MTEDEKIIADLLAAIEIQIGGWRHLYLIPLPVHERMEKAVNAASDRLGKAPPNLNMIPHAYWD